MVEQAVQFVDPFTQVHNALWDLLTSYGPFTDLVSKGNRIKLNGRDRNPSKGNRLDADAPEVRIEPAGVTVDLFATSTSSMIESIFSVELRTDDTRPNNKLFPVQWAIIRAISQADNNLGLSFVHKLTIGDLDIEENEDEDGKKGWKSVIGVEVQMNFDRAKQLIG